MRINFTCLLLLFCVSSLAKPINYGFLQKFEPARKWIPEEDERVLDGKPPAPLDIDLKDHYQEFQKSGLVSIFVGGGAQIYDSSWAQNIFDMLKSSNEKLKLGITGMELSGQTMRFLDKDGLAYRITVGHERNEFISSLGNNQVIIYFGHSRFGRGPAFDEMSNYFRLGNGYPAIEVDTRNKYFLAEPLVDTQTYRPQSVTLGGMPYFYQYVGEKDTSAELPADAYTKRIEGGPKDLRAAKFLDQKQILFLYSCSNVYYFKDTFRERFSDPRNKVVFGTLYPDAGKLEGVAIFIMSLVRRLPSSLDIVGELNKIDNPFTVY